ncbi:type I restriction-modification system subunit M [Chamaesiphon sp.]|uniref:type I restriction-modification system subunit M n=1 Tax=Chamaesiphon sp. TaxID=2814140 RepID=UPI0035935E7E
MTNDQKKQLEAQLWNIADSLRGKMNADEFRDYCLGFIFYKYLSERQHLFANGILAEDGIDFLTIDESSPQGQEYLEAVAEESIAELGYFLKPSELFGSLAKRALGNQVDTDKDEISDEELEKSSIFILGDLTEVLNNIERSTMGNESEEDFDHLFEDLDLTSTKLGRTPKAKNALIAKILVHLNKIDFRLDDSESDVLGDAYEYLIGQFASGAGKKAGEFYTPQQVSKVLAKIVTTGKDRLKSVYDPTCGSGSLLLRVAREVESVGDFYGQEMNRTTYNLARMNMILHGVHYRNFDLKQEDTLEHPQHKGMRFEAVVANPPFSANWSANKLFESDDRFSQYGKLAPTSKADFAFVQHMLHHLDENGTMAVVLPHGVLFRGGAEGHIRQYLIQERNWLDAVIGLPANIFYGTSIPTCILVLKKCREQPEDVLFIDASSTDHFEKVKNQNYLRDEDVEKIITTYRERLAEDKYSCRASLQEIAENDFNLNIPRYVNTFGDEEEIDLGFITQKLAQSQKDLESADKIIREFCDELDLPFPHGCNLHLLQIYRQGVMQKLFSRQIRFPEFKDAWIYPTLGKVTKYTKGFAFKSEAYLNSGVRIIRASDLDSQKIRQENQKIYISQELAENERIKKYRICKGNIIISTVGSKPELRSSAVGRGIYVNNDGEGLLNQNLLKFENIEGINNRFLFGQINTPRYIDYISSIQRGNANQSNITVEDLLNYKISFTSLKEQEKIANFLTAIDQKIDAVFLQTQKTEQ